ncbi:hypothetical protein [Yersinia phage fHe-Yen9-03]|uniref:Uncharacterized protein n=1 Tax=Yersinia phage fHe-Yen9-03 TaxID=2052743 RepID=A0A2C9CY46_9CAUD|nr:hypothetical protein [Yersinia phage fHe-Yen9-03]
MNGFDILILCYIFIGISISGYIIYSYIHGVYVYFKQLYTAQVVRPSRIKIQFGYSLFDSNYDHWGIVIGISFLFTLMHVVCALLIWPVFSIWLISYTIKVARIKNFGDGDY